MADPVVSSARKGKESVLEGDDLMLTEVIAEVRRQRAIIMRLEDQQDRLLTRLAEVEAWHKSKRSEFSGISDVE